VQYEPAKAGSKMSEILRGAQKDRGVVRRPASVTIPWSGWSRIGLPPLVVLTLFGCAPARPLVLQPQATAAVVGPAYATVTAVRPIRPVASNQETAILAAMGVAPSAGSSTSSEIVVRTAAGQTLSVVQPNAAHLAPGDKVMVVPGGVTRLEPVPPPS
jgi:outer membrane lipoprotein SlyB